MKIDFTEQERSLVEEKFQEYMQVVTIVARLHGIKGAELASVSLAQDRSGLVLPEVEGGQLCL